MVQSRARDPHVRRSPSDSTIETILRIEEVRSKGSVSRRLWIEKIVNQVYIVGERESVARRRISVGEKRIDREYDRGEACILGVCIYRATWTPDAGRATLNEPALEDDRGLPRRDAPVAASCLARCSTTAQALRRPSGTCIRMRYARAATRTYR